MSIASLNRLGELIVSERQELLAAWRRQVRELPAARELDRPTLDDHIPDLLDELAEALKDRRDESISELMLQGTPPAHGIERLEEGFDLEEVVAEYNILRGVIHDLAESNGIDIRGRTFHILNRVLDTSIGLAVQTYATQRALEVKRRREEYLAFVAHDLRTPLSAVSLSTALLELSVDDCLRDPQVALAFSTLKRNVKQLEELVSMVLKENTVESGTSVEKLVRRQFDLWPHVESVFRNVAPVAATNSTELVNEVPAELRVYADAGMLTRILQNLVSNAIRYSPRGRVSVSARITEPGHTVECSVVDTGDGIASDQLEKVFEKFETDPAHPEGIGLGLAIVKEFVEAHGGEVTVDSKPGDGTTFRFTLPGQMK
jgi:two-component system, OmpR family, phosphate regulon sensor histidine kinase PhoR